jgi:hypothetical protein
LVAKLFRQLFLVCLRRSHTRNEESHFIRQLVLPLFLKTLSQRTLPNERNTVRAAYNRAQRLVERRVMMQN